MGKSQNTEKVKMDRQAADAHNLTFRRLGQQDYHKFKASLATQQDPASEN